MKKKKKKIKSSSSMFHLLHDVVMILVLDQPSVRIGLF